MATLLVLGMPNPGERKSILNNRHLIVGRDSTCDLVISNQAISRFHAQVISLQGQYFVEDMGSTNGTFLNGRRLQKRERLYDQDRISLHDVCVGFFLHDLDNSDVAQTCRPVDVPKEVVESRRLATTTQTRSVGHPARNLKGQLETLIEITRYLGSSLQLDVILPRVLDLLFCSFEQASLGEIHLLDPDGQIRPVAMKHGRDADSTDLTGVPLNVDLIQEVLQAGRGIVRREDAGGPAMAMDELHQCTICVPILGPESTPFGVIILQSDGSASYGFDEGDLQLVSAVGVIAGQSIGYARAHAIMVQHRDTERQLETARHVQLSMLPRERPKVQGYEFFHHYAAAERVGGDYFFHEMMRDGRVIFGIADASGKGLPAAMNIMRFAGEVKLRIATSPTLKSAVSSLNRFILANAEECMFITACFGVLDPESHVLTLANAGHPHPLIRHQGASRVSTIASSQRCFPLGISEAMEVHPVSLTIAPGDQILLYTDGVSEAMNPANDLFGAERLAAAVETSGEGVESIVRAVVDAVTLFRHGRTNSDDMTILGFGRHS